MAIYGAFSTSVLGMMSQTAALHNIGTNVANVNTGGYKRIDTSFSTVLSHTVQTLSDIGGVRPSDKSTITQQGNIVSSESATDVAIAGKGFFVLNTKQDGSGQQLFTRDGSLEIATVNDVSVTGIGGTSVTTKDGYLVDKNGYFVQGWPYTNGTVSTSATPQSLRVDQYAFIGQFEPTTTATLGLNLPANDAIGKVRQFDVSLTDSLGARQTAQLNFTKTGINTWSVTSTTSQAPVAQVDTVTLGGSVGEVGDVYSVTVNGVTKTYTTLGTEANIDVIRDALVTSINADTSINGAVTASAGATGALLITSDTAGTTITTSATATQGPASVAQVDNITLAGGVVAGDTYSVTINGTAFTATAGAASTLTTLRNDLIAQINADPTASALVTATPSGADQLVITADTAGTPITLSTATTDAGGAPANTISATNVTPNFTAVADNTASAVTTTANAGSTQTSAATAMTFNANGQLSTPTTLNLALSFSSGSTASIAIDISPMTQYSSAGDDLNASYSKNGYASANMRSFSFDTNGNVIGVFEDDTYRSIYKLSLGVFANPDGLDPRNGNVYAVSPESGNVTITSADSNGYAVFTPNARELSNVDIAEEFTRMMTTQTAYNASSTVFKTTDEMTTVARDLKR
ncbi:flagellar hook-basal body complex protein [Magnetovibrio sp.]|uniref:flagellar hook-basal body complex protein n=1 Tax=Magnetovibrio sp. TaxID=2024836 RepID=UPI002F94418C